MKDAVCVKDKVPGRFFSIDNTRYFTYVGLVVATAIIFHRSMLLAAVVGALVSVYIGFTEYYLANNEMNGDLQPSIIH